MATADSGLGLGDLVFACFLFLKSSSWAPFSTSKWRWWLLVAACWILTADLSFSWKGGERKDVSYYLDMDGGLLVDRMII